MGGYIGVVNLVGEVREVGMKIELEHPAVGVRGPFNRAFLVGRQPKAQRTIIREIQAAARAGLGLENPLEGWDGAGTGFILSDPRPVEFIAARGKLGMFFPDAEVLANLKVFAPSPFNPKPWLSWKEWVLQALRG